MNICIRSLGICVSSLFFLLPTPALSAQEPAAPRSTATTAAAAEPQSAGQIVSSPSQVVPALPVPRLIKFSGVAKDASGQRRSGTVGITFSIYAEQQGGATLWMETQNAALDAQGRYAVLLGSTESSGLPLDLFATGEPRWLGAKLELPGEVEQPRVLLVSVPYALKASDADTVGGMPASAFVLAPTGAGANASTPGSAKSTAAKSKAEPLFTSSGTTNYIPIFTDSTGDIGNSTIYQSTAGNVGIGFSNPQQRLVIGAPAGGTVLNATNLSDQDLNVIVTAPGATDKHTYFGPSVATNLTLGVGGVEKVRINSAGNVGIGDSNPQQRLVIGAPAGGTVLNATNLSDQDLQVNVTAPGASDKHTYFGPSVATNLTLGVGGAEKMRITNAGNVGIGTTTPAYPLDVNGIINSLAGFGIGGNLFAFGSYANKNVFLGFAGNATTTGSYNTASGYQALYSNTTGYVNTASGIHALFSNTTGCCNTASGQAALYSNTTGCCNTASGSEALLSNTGYYNTAVGEGAMTENTTGDYNTASGAIALNSNTTGGGNTASGYDALLFNTTGNYNTASGYQALYSNTTGNDNTASGYYAGQTTDSNPLTGSNNTAVGYYAEFGLDSITNATAIGANAEVAESNAMVLGSINGVNGATANTNVGIGTTAPTTTLHVVSSSTYQPVLIQSSSSFGTWLELGNTSTGGHTWNILSAGGANGEGAGNLGITDLTGKSTIDLEGNVNISGSLTKNSGSFKIDHPLDPANKYLYHSFVESPDVKNIYDGVVTLDARGSVWITLPEYFGALNQDFRYQLTSIGRPQPSLYVAREISGNRFRISGGKPGGKVSWQVTGIRHDAYADAHRIQVEVEKPRQEQGRYLHPELFGAAAEQAISYHAAAASPNAERQ